MTNKPTEMELRVQRAIAMESFYSADEGADGVPQSLKVARAAIRAMRQETDDMNDAGADVVDARMLAETGFCGPIWKAMIDAASPQEKD